MTVNELPTDNFYNWIDGERSKKMANCFNRQDWLTRFRTFLVWVENGEYKEVYGCVTGIPYLKSEAKYLVKDGKIIDYKE